MVISNTTVFIFNLALIIGLFAIQKCRGVHVRLEIRAIFIMGFYLTMEFISAANWVIY